jgi:signal transduction histidine kinase
VSAGAELASVEALAAIHEIRGALTAIGLAIELARRTGGLAPERLRGLALEIERAGCALAELEQLHLGAPAATGAPGSRPREAVDLRELVEACAQSGKVVARGHGASLESSWSGPPAWIWGDRVGLAQVIANLLANALEHGSGPVAARGSMDGSGRARIVVSDCGSGLPATVRELIGRGCAGGSGRRGWGLRIAADVAAAHGGRIGAAPSPEGARLVLELPASDSAERARAVGIAAG